MKKKMEKVLMFYSACKICTREKTKVCDKLVPEIERQIYFMTTKKKYENEITKRCKYFRLHKGKTDELYRKLKEMGY